MDTVQIPYTYYNVQTTNNKLVINWNSANHTLTVPAGNYTSSQLLTELNSLISAVNSNLSVTYDSNTWTFSFIFSSALPNTGSLILSQSTINQLIGFLSPAVDTAAAGTVTSAIPAQFMDNRFLFIECEQLGDNVLSSTPPNKYSWYIPNIVNGGDMLSYQNNLDHNQEFLIDTGSKYYHLHFTLQDESGNILNLNGSDWSMVLKLYTKGDGL